MSICVYIEDREHPGPGGSGTRQRAMVAGLELREIVPGRATARGPYTVLEGRAVPYGEDANLRWFLEQHDTKSMLKTTAGSAKNAPLQLFHNNAAFPIGHAEQWTHDGGLDGVWRLNATSQAQEAAELANGGDLTGMSIGFVPIRSKWEFVDEWDPDAGPDHMDRVTRLENRLIEVSITPTPAFAGAQVQAIRQSPDGLMVDGMTIEDYRELRKLLGPGTPRLDEWRRYASTL
jgi:HK97 family phage prohead protease